MLPLPSSGSNLLLEELLVDFDFDAHIARAELFYVFAETFAIYLKNIEPIIGLASYIYLYIEGENMKKQKIWTIVSFLALMGLVACGDGDSSSGAVDETTNIEVVDEENSSESKISSSSVKESSSSKKVSSSSVKESSSSKKVSSSSVEETSSSEQVSSSSVEESSSSTEIFMCGDQIYDPSEFYCDKGQVVEMSKCGKKETRYDPTTRFCDTRDSKVYLFKAFSVPDVGMVSWMVENLNHEVTGRSRCFNDSSIYCDKFGQLYTWATAIDKPESVCGYEHDCNLPDGKIKGVCPDDWHLPSKKEWEDLFKAVGETGNAGKVLKSDSGWVDDKYTGNSGNGDDLYGFTVYPAGKCNSSDICYKLGEQAPFWTSIEDIANGSFYAVFYNHSDEASVDYPTLKDDYLGVRCVRDY